MVLRRSLPAVALWALAAQACGSAVPTAAGPAVRVGSKNPSKARLVSPARVVALPEAGSSFIESDPDGSTRFIARGMRVLSKPDGAIERAHELFPSGRQVRALHLPDRLGGGFLFYTNFASTTQIWRASSWTSDLQPLANLDFDVERISDGFDRLYVSDQRSLDVIALDPKTGKSVDLGSLPPAPAYSSLAFADAWFGAVEVPFRGVLVTFDAGASWRALGIEPSYGLSVEQGEIVVTTNTGRWVIDANGTLRQRGAGTNDDALFVGAGRRPSSVAPNERPTTPPEPPPAPPIGPLGKMPLRTALLHGVADTTDTAVVAQDSALGRVRLSDGKLLGVEEHALPAGSRCDGVPLGDGFGFVCGQERGGTTVYAYSSPLTLTPVVSFPDPRFVASSGNGALVIRGPCSGPASAAPGAYCIRSRDGRRSEMRVRGDLGVERIIAMSDGRTAVLVPPRLGAPGTLTLVEANGSAKTVKLKLPKEDAPTLAMLKKGLWLEGMTEREAAADEPDAPTVAPKKSKSSVSRPRKGKYAPQADKTAAKPKDETPAKSADEPKKKGKRKQIMGWVVAAGPFVGVRVELDGTLHVGKIESDIDRAMLSNEYGLVLGRGGTASETTDGGFEWSEVDLPPDSADPAARTKTDLGLERGCSRVGCVVGSWMRVGWRGKSDKPDLVTVDPPPSTVIASSGGGRWNLTCAPSGEMRGPAPKLERPGRQPAGEAAIGVVGGYPGYYGGYGYPGYPGYPGRATAGQSGDELQSSEWTGFKGVAGPPKKKTELGFDLATEYLTTQMHAYVWGARGAAWDRVGNLVVRGYDPYSLDNAVWSSAEGRPSWNDGAAGAAVFGRDMNQPSAWYPTFEPSGRAMAILIQARGTVEMLLAEEGKSPVSIQDVAKWGLYQALNGAVKLGSTWYMGAYQAGSSFRLFRVENGRVVLVKEYPMTGGWRPNTTLNVTLVRNVRGDALGIWVEARRTRGVATSWYVYALDPDNGEVIDMLPIEPRSLAAMPPPCSDDADGWLLVGEPPVEPYVDFVQSANNVRSRRIEAKLVAQSDGLCVESLVSEADTDVPARLSRGDLASFSHGREPVSMVLEERGRTGRRWGFRCVR